MYLLCVCTSTTHSQDTPKAYLVPFLFAKKNLDWVPSETNATVAAGR